MAATFTSREIEQPTYGAAFNTDEIIRRNRESGSHFFDTDTTGFFGSRVLAGVYGGRFFVTSERSGFDDPTRSYTVREAMPDGSIETVGEFNGYHTPSAARTAIRALLKSRHTYYFDGQHGKGGRKRCYLVTADDPWAALGRLHANFRVFNCGRAYDWMTPDASDHYVALEA